jgi:hypothetical protein
MKENNKIDANNFYSNQGKYFENRNLYDYGTDNDISKAYDWFCDERNTLYIMLKHLPIVKPTHGCTDDDEGVNGIIENINFNVKEKYEKMVYLNFYIVVDECLSKIYKAIGMYHNELITNHKVKISYSDLMEHDIENDKIEMFIDIITDEKNISNKLKDIKNIFKDKFNYEIPKKFLNEMEKFRIERNVLVHSKGVLNKKVIKEIENKRITYLYDNLNIGDTIEYSLEKIERLMDIVSYNIEDLCYPVIKFYDLNFKLDPKDREFVESLRRKY